MSTGKIQVYYGEGRGKTSAALGYAIHEASKGESVIVIQFLKQKDEDEISFLGRLEPEIRLFRFQKSEKFYRELPAEEQLEEQMNMKNGINYARKVLQTGECDILILDEVLGLLDEKIVPEEEILQLMALKSDDMHMIMTGQVISDGILKQADDVYEICIKKEGSVIESCRVMFTRAICKRARLRAMFLDLCSRRGQRLFLLIKRRSLHHYISR